MTLVALGGVKTAQNYAAAQASSKNYSIAKAIPVKAPNYVGRAIAASHINLGLEQAPSDSNNFYAGLSFNTIAMGSEGAAALIGTIPWVKKTPWAKNLVDGVAKFAKDNPFAKNFCNVEYDWNPDPSGCILHLKFNLLVLTKLSKNQQDVFLEQFSNVLKTAGINANSVKILILQQKRLLKKYASTATPLNSFANDSSKFNDDQRRKIELRISINPNTALGQNKDPTKLGQKNLQLRIGFQFSKFIPFKKGFKGFGLTGSAGFALFCAIRQLANGELRFTIGAEIDADTKLGYGSFATLGFANTFKMNYLRQKDGHLGIEVMDNGRTAFMPLPKEFEENVRLLNLGNLNGVRESVQPTHNLEDYLTNRFTDKLPKPVLERAKLLKKYSDTGKPVLDFVARATFKLAEKKVIQEGVHIGIQTVNRGLKKIVPQIAKKMPWIGEIAEASNEIGWAIAGVTAVHDLWEWNQNRQYRDIIKDLYTKGVYRPDQGIKYVFDQTKKNNDSMIGFYAKDIAATIDYAVHNNANVLDINMRREWSKKLKYIGKTSQETQIVRLVAATILGREDAIKDNLKLKMQTPQEAGSYENAAMNNQMVISLNNLKDIKSKTLAPIDPKNDTKYRKVGQGFNSIKTANIDGDIIEAIPGQVAFNDKTTWRIMMTSGDGLSSTINAPLTGQIELKAFASTADLIKSLKRDINAQRSQFKKVPAYIKPYQDNLYGRVITATPLYMKKSGEIMWRVTTKSKSGASINIYNTLGLDNQTGYQFDRNDLQQGHIFRIELDGKIKNTRK